MGEVIELQKVKKIRQDTKKPRKKKKGVLLIFVRQELHIVLNCLNAFSKEFLLLLI